MVFSVLKGNKNVRKREQFHFRLKLYTLQTYMKYISSYISDLVQVAVLPNTTPK